MWVEARIPKLEKEVVLLGDAQGVFEDTQGATSAMKEHRVHRFFISQFDINLWTTFVTYLWPLSKFI